jgi:hypothetical protein
MSISWLFELKSPLLAEVRSGLLECEQNKRPDPNMFSTLPVVGMFRVRRTLEVSDKVQQIVEAVLRGDKDIRLDGIRIVVPTTRKHVFEPALPVFVAALGTEIDVSIKSVELVRDQQTDQPALLITTASSLKPDLVVVLSVLPEKEQNPAPITDWLDDSTDRLLLSEQVPSKHHKEVRKAARYAWHNGITATTVRKRLPKTGRFSNRNEIEAVAKEIVQQLADQHVVSMGLFFWMRLGYWLLKIVMLLIESEQQRAMVATGEYIGQSTTMRRSG